MLASTEWLKSVPKHLKATFTHAHKTGAEKLYYLIYFVVLNRKETPFPTLLRVVGNDASPRRKTAIDMRFQPFVSRFVQVGLLVKSTPKSRSNPGSGSGGQNMSIFRCDGCVSETNERRAKP